MEAKKRNYFIFGAVFLILLICLLSDMKYFTEGKTVYHINSVTASPFVYIKLQIDNFRNLRFYPQYWITLIGAGIPIHSGLGVYNPLLLLLVFFDNFGHAMVFYEIFLKFISGLGILVLLRKFRFSWLASLCCAMIYPLNHFTAAYGQDPQFVSVIYILPWIYVFIELIIDNLARKNIALCYSLILSIVLSICYLSSNIQFYTFLFSFAVLAYVILRGYIMFTEKRMKKIKIFIFFMGLVFMIHILLILFESIPTINVIRHGNRFEEISSFTNNIRILIYLSFLLILVSVFRRCLTIKNYFISLTCVSLILFILIFNIDYRPSEFATIKNLVFVNYLQKVDELSFHFGNQKFWYFYTFLQLILMTIVLFRKKALRDKRFILFYLALAYLCLEFISHNKWAIVIHHIYPRYFFRISFLPFVGMMIGFAAGIDCLRAWILKWAGLSRIVSVLILLIIPMENYYVYMNRTLLTDGLQYIERDGFEYNFLRNMKATERMIDAYNDDHNNWMKGNRPRLFPKWLMPPLFGANTLSRVGVNMIPKENAEYNKFAMPLPSPMVPPGNDGLFGVDENKPLNSLLNLAGVKYIFALKEFDKDKNLKLLSKNEYFIYENLSVLPRVMLLPKVELVEGDVLNMLRMQDNNDLLDRAFIEKDEGIILNNSGTNKIELMDDTKFVSNLGKVNIVEYENEYVKVDCDIKEECYFILTDTYYYGWKAFVNGSERRIIRTDYIYRGLPLYPGRYELVMRYMPLANRVSVLISFITFIFVLIVLAISIWRNII